MVSRADQGCAVKTPRLDVRVHEYKIGEVTARLHSSVVAEIVGRAPDAFAPDATALAMEDLARRLEDVAHALYQGAIGMRQGVKP